MTNETTPNQVLGGEKFAKELVGLLTKGVSTEQLRTSIITHLHKLQAKQDLAVVGLAHYHLSRTERLMTMINDVERRIFDGEPDAGIPALLFEIEDPSILISLLKVLNNSMQNSADFLTKLTVKSTISSPSNMEGATEERNVTPTNVPAVGGLSAESRRRIARVANILLRSTEKIVEYDINPDTTPAESLATGDSENPPDAG